MKRTLSIATAAAAALTLAAITLAAPAPYRPLLDGAGQDAVRITSADAAGFAPRTAVKRVAAVAKKRTAKSKATTAPKRPKAPAKRKAATAPKRPKSPAPLPDATRAQQILTALIAKYPILEGTTVEMGYAQGYQAVCYYRSGRIVISPTHTASLDRILNHEIWHVIDFRIDGAINWGENLPPANASSFQG